MPGAPGEIIAPETFEGESDRSKQAKRMAEEARACVAKHMFTWAFARTKTSADNCEVFDIEHALLTNNDNLKEALIQIVASDEFIQR